jgi:hypothetical protein
MKIRNALFVLGMVCLLSIAQGTDIAASGPRLTGEEKRQAVRDASAARSGGRISSASAFQTIPLVANYQENGIWTKTYMSITNPASKDITVYLTLYTTAGEHGTLSVQLNAYETKSWSDLIGYQGFNFEGRGALEIDSWFGPPNGSSADEFIVHLGLHRLVPGLGRLFTVVEANSSLDSVGGSNNGWNTGVPNNAWRRTSVGVFNDGLSSAGVMAYFIDSSGKVIETVNFTVPAHSWAEKPLTQDLSVGCVQWSSSSTIFAYALTTDTHTGDMNFQPAIPYIP